MVKSPAKTSIRFLITHIGKSDPHLFTALNMLNDSLNQTIETVTTPSPVVPPPPVLMPHTIYNFIPGMPSAGLQILQWGCPGLTEFPNGVTFLANFADSISWMQAAPAATAVYNFYKVARAGKGIPPAVGATGVLIGKLSISTLGVVTPSTVNSLPYNFQWGDFMTAFAPSPQDTALSGFGFQLVGHR
jgi:uncharacterized phage infection (PIP) family protein YhgE